MKFVTHSLFVGSKTFAGSMDSVASSADVVTEIGRTVSIDNRGVKLRSDHGEKGNGIFCVGIFATYLCAGEAISVWLRLPVLRTPCRGVTPSTRTEEYSE
jgi:hypothetical protein